MVGRGRSKGRTLLTAKRVRELKDPAINSGVLIGGAVVGNVVIAVFGADRSGLRSIQFDSCSEVECEIE
jgi:hypothetical protein